MKFKLIAFVFLFLLSGVAKSSPKWGSKKEELNDVPLCDEDNPDLYFELPHPPDCNVLKGRNKPVTFTADVSFVDLVK